FLHGGRIRPASCTSAAIHRTLPPQLSTPPQELILTRTAIATTARRGQTPEAHGQPSSPPLLSLACSLQHKLTPRQQGEKQKDRHGRHTTHSHRTATNGRTPAAAHTPRDRWNQYDCRARTPHRKPQV
ncbi:hypothetical protein TcCL_Unassigned05626, partial [Trypanosoma cruzi]